MDKIQEEFIELLKKNIPSQTHLATELSDLLGLSIDSIYRRFRGQTSISLAETVTICKHYSIPLNSLSESSSSSVNFQINKLSNDPSTFRSYLNGLLEGIQGANTFEERKMIYAAEDLPVFYHFFLPNLARFKSAYWTKSIMNLPEVQLQKVEDIESPEEWKEISTNIGREFLNLPSVEIWTEDTLKSTLQQIKFYWEAGFFSEKQTALDVIQDVKILIQCVQRQAEMGKKIHPAKMQATSTDYELYISDLMIGNNTVSLQTNENKSTYIGYNTFNYMVTKNTFFNENVDKWLNNFIGKSTLVSQVAEKQRNQFFKKQGQTIEELNQFIQNDFLI